MINRLLYLGYHFKNLEFAKVHQFMRYVQLEQRRSNGIMWADIIWSCLRYKISILEYFQFAFYKASPEDRKKWAGTGYMYEYQRLMNPLVSRRILDDKYLFFQHYRKFFRHKVYSTQEFSKNHELFDELKNSVSRKIVIKASNGKCGAQVKILDTEGLSREQVLRQLKEDKYDMVEEFINQHIDLSRLAPNAVNTVRIITQLNDRDDVEILGCRQRLSVFASVDNLAAGNIAAPIDEKTGRIIGSGVYSDITKKSETVHPVSGMKIVGFQVPFWEECISLAKEAALHDKTNRSIGWDIVVTDSGPGLIEGNHDWCKLVWQLPVNKGLKQDLERHLQAYSSKDV